MKKYKLIKEYPGSPKLGVIWDDYSPGCAKYPEFWEEVVEKDYEILSYYSKYKKYIYDLQSNGTCIARNIKKGGICFNENLFKKNCIYSVKRLSDGEVFTIGDEIIYNDIFPTKLRIKSIQLFNGEILIHKDCTMNTNKLSEIQHYKKPLFTTEDGVDIFEEGIEVFTVDNDFNLETDKIKICKPFVKEYPLEHWYKGTKIFSTKESAEEYILMNKPCLSINDLIKTDGVYFEGDLKLKKLVKSRL